jgi:hypothetical protein
MQASSMLCAACSWIACTLWLLVLLCSEPWTTGIHAIVYVTQELPFLGDLLSGKEQDVTQLEVCIQQAM